MTNFGPQILVRRIWVVLLAVLVAGYAYPEQARSANGKDRPADSTASRSAPPPKAESQPSPIAFDLGLSTWLSQGNTKWSQNASTLDPTLGNPTSELEYENLWSTMVVADAQVTLPNSLFFRLQGGYGGIEDGTLIDDDFLSGQVLAIRTESDIDGNNVYFVNADVGFQFLRFPKNRGALKAFAGFQYWREEAVAKGARFIVPAGPELLAGQEVITNTAQWSSVRIGVEGDVRFTRRFSLDGNFAFIPFTSLNNEDIHHQRNDLRKDPSFEMTGTGLGLNAEAEAKFRIIPHLFLNAGFRFWWLRVTDGDFTSFPVSGSPLTVNLNEFQSMRYGPTIGLDFVF